MFSFGETVTHHHRVRGEPDGYGGHTDAWVEETLGNVGVAMTNVDEPTADGLNRLVKRCTLYFRPPLVVNSSDEFTVRGERYKVESGGGLAVWHSPLTGSTPGSEVSLRRVTG